MKRELRGIAGFKIEMYPSPVVVVVQAGVDASRADDERDDHADDDDNYGDSADTAEKQKSY